MKKFLFTLLGFLLCALSSNAQTCLPNGIVFTEQSQIDSFSINYPGCTTIEGNLVVFVDTTATTNLLGLSQITEIQGSLFITQTSLDNLSGLENVIAIGGNLSVFYYTLNSLSGLDNLTTLGGYLSIEAILGTGGSFTDLSPLSNLESIGGFVSLIANDSLQSLHGLENITTVSGYLDIAYNRALTDLSALSNLTSIGGNLILQGNNSLVSLEGLENLTSIPGYLGILDNENLTQLSALSSILYIGGVLHIRNNSILTNLAGLENAVFDNLYVSNNPLLSECSIASICDFLLNPPGNLDIHSNGSGCSSVVEIQSGCGGQPVIVKVLANLNDSCQPDPTSSPVQNVNVHFDAINQSVIRPTGADGVAVFYSFDPNPFYLSLPQFPSEYWRVCEDTILIDPANFPDTIFTTVMLSPLNLCPNLVVNLDLPPVFRGCLINSNFQVQIQNDGVIPAENVQAAVIIPASVFEVLSTSTPIFAQNGDTLFFSLGDLGPFESSIVHFVVKTRCDTFLLGQTLCIEAFANPDNNCPPESELFSEIRLFSQCLNDETVRFTIQNVGNAPTQGTHEYVIIEDEVVLMTDVFDLDPQQTRIVDVPANGSTYRMEATRSPDGTLTAIALENCGGLTPGLINAYWLNLGPENHALDCREVVLAYDPNQKTAIPKGVGDEHLLPANRTLKYTIEFQNTGTDTAFRVLLTDVLSPYLDVTTFKPGSASHDYTWEIKDNNVLKVLFFPIALPDSSDNLAGSQGFFTFDIDQSRDLPNGTVIENMANIVFDYNPPIATNTVFHTIGELLVVFNNPKRETDPVWTVFANPVSTTATFQTKKVIAGEKRFELFDPSGRLVRTHRFEGREFLFERRDLPSNMYFFRITDIQGRSATGKIVIAE